MSHNKTMPATDSARDLENLVHDDATADFESDPKFIDSPPDASSENLAFMRDTDDEEESEDELDDEEEEEEDDEDEEGEYDDDDDEDEDDDEDDEDEEDDEDDEDDDDDEEYEDDEDEVGSSKSRLILKHAA